VGSKVSGECPIIQATLVHFVQGAMLEPSLAEARVGETVQFERLGYFAADPDSRPDALVSILTSSAAVMAARSVSSNLTSEIVAHVAVRTTDAQVAVRYRAGSLNSDDPPVGQETHRPRSPRSSRVGFGQRAKHVPPDSDPPDA